MLEVVFYLTGEGKSPVREYLDSLDAKQAASALDICRDENDTPLAISLSAKDDRHG